MNVKVNRGLFAYVLLCFFLLLNDYIEYITKIDYKASLVFSGLITFVVWKKYISKHVDTYKINLNKFDAAAICIIIFFGLLRIAIPDSGWDTLNYHIYFEQFLGRDFVNYDFFPNRVMNEVSLYFGDRVLYFFRYFLGYRVGSEFNTFIAVLFYVQLKDFVKNVLIDMKTDFEVKDYAVALIALSGVLIENFLLEFNLYYVDLMALPFILECLRIVIFDDENSSSKMYFIAAMAGLSVSLKMSNAFFLIPLALAYILKFRKSINLKNYVISILIALFTVALYLFISLRLTGNPLFPYLNGLFKSPYFATDVSPNTLSNFYCLFGPKNILQFLFWPVYIWNNQHLCSNSDFYVGYIIQCMIILLIAFFTKKKYGRKILYIDIIWIIYYFIYLIPINGYNRYAIIMDSLSAVIVGIYCYVWISENNSTILKFFSYAAIISVLITFGIAVDNVEIQGINWVQAKSALVDFNLHKENAKYLFRDYDSGIDKKIVDDVDYWYVTEYNSGYACLIKPDVPIITANYGVTNDVSEQIYNNNLEKMKGKNVYTFSTKYSTQYLVKQINDANFKIKDVYVSKCNYCDITKPIMFAKIEYDDNFDKNEEVYNLRGKKEFEIDLQNYENRGYKSEFFIGPDVISPNWNSDSFFVRAELVSDNGSRELFDTKWQPGDPYVNEYINIPKNYIDKDAKIRFTVYNTKYNADNVSLYDNWVTIIEQSDNNWGDKN